MEKECDLLDNTIALKKQYRTVTVRRTSVAVSSRTATPEQNSAGRHKSCYSVMARHGTTFSEQSTDVSQRSSVPDIIVDQHTLHSSIVGDDQSGLTSGVTSAATVSWESCSKSDRSVGIPPTRNKSSTLFSKASSILLKESNRGKSKDNNSKEVIEVTICF